VDPYYIIKHYFVYTFDQKIKNVELESFHPNCDPESKMFCLPKNMIGKKIDYKTLKKLEDVFRIFNLDDCYYAPWRKFIYNN